MIEPDLKTAAGEAKTGEAKFSGRRIHFIGIGGIGMSGIASILLRQGYIVSGSDLKNSPTTEKLVSLGIKIFIGHDRAQIYNADTVVYSSAVKEDNPELSFARDKGLTVIRRAQALAWLMRDKTCIAVSGAHGKTTTAALISHLLLACGFCPTVALGGILRNLEDNACVGQGNFFVAEADESDGTFLYYRMRYPIITNIDREHLDYYPGWEDILSAYKSFMLNMQEEGCLFCCGDDPAIRQVSRDFKNRIVYFGLSGENDFYPRDITLNEFSSDFECCYKGGSLGRMHLSLSGRHNISNSLAAVALGRELGIKPADIAAALADFKGTERRFQLKADARGIKIIDDYGHHPAEIRATLLAARNVKHKRLIVVFQPHRYSRTKFLMEDFVQSLSLADYLVLTDIYAAQETPLAGISSQALCDKIKKAYPKMDALYLPKEKIVNELLPIVRTGDLIITLGAGDIGRLSDELAQRFECRNP